MGITRIGTYGQIKGTKDKLPCRLATTGSDITLSGAQSIDGIAVVTGDRIFVKNQTTGQQNGIYVANTAGAWVRAIDFSQSDDVFSGVTIFVTSGNTLSSSNWHLSTTDPIVLDSTVLSFSQMATGHIARHDYVAPYSYCGTAPLGSAEGASVWTIFRITVNADGSVITQSATAVDWTSRYTHTYT